MKNAFVEGVLFFIILVICIGAIAISVGVR
jgi:hypothetical protein